MSEAVAGSGRLAGRRAIVTGAARGIGLAFAEAYRNEGADVVVLDVDPAGEDAADGIGASFRALDVRDVAAIEAVVADIARDGPIDILVNNAALFDLAPITEVTEASFDTLFAINVKGPTFLMKAVANAMLAAPPADGHNRKIINMASQAGRRGEALVAVYCATKAAVISLTQSAGLALAPHGINVNAIAPGVVDGVHWDGVDAKFAAVEGKAPGQKKREVGAAVPYGRMGTAEDLTGMAVFLASPESDYIVAQCYGVDGGNWMA